MGLIVQKGVPYPNPEYTIHELTDVDDSNKSDGSSLVYNAANSKYESKVITKSLTWAEYQALSEEEKNNGTAYFITDVNRYEYGSGYVAKSLLSAPITSPSTGNISLLEDYTKFDELEFLFGVNASNADQVYCYKLDVQELISGKHLFAGGMVNKLYGAYIQFGYYDSTTITITGVEKNGWSEALKIYDIKGVKYETEGVHYSTSEQVIGTWIDGSTIYEKTFNVGSQSGADVSYNHNITNFGLLISIIGRCTQPTGDHLPLPYVGLNSTSWSVALGNVTSTQFRIQKGSGIGTLSDVYVTIRYTKSS